MDNIKRQVSNPGNSLHPNIKNNHPKNQKNTSSPNMKVSQG